MKGLNKRVHDHAEDNDEPKNKKKKRQQLVIMEKVEMNHQDLIDTVNEWFDDYDNKMRKTLPYLNLYIKNDMICKAAAFYEKQHNNILLETDLLLCKNICPIQVLHIVARLWSLKPHTYDYSREQHYFFHVIKNQLARHEAKFNAFMTRLVDLSASYNNHNCEDIKARHIPVHQQVALATFYYSNLSFMGIDRHSGDYHIACDNLKQRSAFNNVVSRIHGKKYDEDDYVPRQQYHRYDSESEDTDDSIEENNDDDEAFTLFTVEALEEVIKSWNLFLEKRFFEGKPYDKFDKMPVVLGWRKKVRYESITPF